MISQQDKARIRRYIKRAISMKMAIRSLDSETEYPGFAEAALALGVKHKRLGTALFFGHRCKGEHWEAVGMDEHEARVNLARINNPGDHRKRPRCE